MTRSRSFGQFMIARMLSRSAPALCEQARKVVTSVAASWIAVAPRGSMVATIRR
jgi:hypothetical protein